MNLRKTPWLAWVGIVLITLAALFNAARDFQIGSAQGDLPKAGGTILFDLFPIVFAIVGALIVSRQTRNLIGWLLMVPAITAVLQAPAAIEIQSVPSLPQTMSLPLWLATWFAGIGWVLFIFPVLFIALLFPTGKPPSRRWLWAGVYAMAVVAFFLFIATFVKTIEMDSSAFGTQWSVANPIGFIPDELAGALFGPVWDLALGLAALLCIAAPFVRYRRASSLVKTQLKWLLYACGLFFIAYVPEVFFGGNLEGPVGNLLSAMLIPATLGIPVAIAIAILRYRLYDIDIIIRRTFIYASLTALLALLYFGSVVLLQELFRALTGQSSEIAIIISTLAIAALFVPLRRRIQDLIDRRFYRQKYDAQKVLAAFGTTVRDEVELDKLTNELFSVVNGTMQPEHVSLWLKRTEDWRMGAELSKGGNQ